MLNAVIAAPLLNANHSHSLESIELAADSPARGSPQTARDTPLAVSVRGTPLTINARLTT